MLRKTLFLIVLTAFLRTDLKSQNQLSMVAGYNRSKLYEKGNTDNYRYGPPEFESKPAYFLSVSYAKKRNHLIHWETSVDITSKFVSVNSQSGGKTSSYINDCDYKLYYSNLSYCPVIELGKKIKFSFLAGPSAGILFSSKRTGTGAYSNLVLEPSLTVYSDEPLRGDANDDIAIWTVDIKAGVRIEYPLSEKAGIVIESRYSQGINNISKISNFEFACKNYSVGTGLSFKL